MRRAAALALAACVLPAAAVAETQMSRAKYDVRVFARVPAPGSPEPVVVAPDRSVYVGTNQIGKGGEENASAPSRVFRYSPAGKLLRSYVLRGQPLDQDHGIQGLALDGDGQLHVLDRSADPRLVVLDPETGAQRRYASFRDVAPCSTGAPAGNCSATTLDMPSGPDYVTIAPDGTMYVTDIDQALIWRVKRGGGRPEVWFTDPRLESVFGPNGIQLMADRRTLLFAQTGSNPNAGNSTTGRLYKLPILPNGKAGELTQFWESLPGEGPDGLAIARSGNVYVALAGAGSVAVISPAGEQVARIPPTPVQNAAQEVPFNGPASAAFDGRRLLVTNQGFPEGSPETWAVLDVFTGEPGLPLHRPHVLPLELGVAPKRAVVGERTTFRFRVTLGGRPVRDALVRFTGRRVRTGARGRARMRFVPKHAWLRRPVAVKRGYLRGRAVVRFVNSGS